jgi:hypothetical protein
MAVGAQGIASALDTLRAEARRCKLFCVNCQAEVENGVAVVPIE